MQKFLAAIALTLGTAAPAQQLGTYSEVRVLPGHMTQSGHYLAGVEITMAPGWKTYWRHPGEGGIPPVFDWSGSQNVTSAQVEWPVPEVFDTYGLRSLGYRDRVIFPVLFEVEDPTKDAELSLGLSFGLCSDICIPAFAQAHSPAPIGKVANQPVLLAARARITTPATGITVRCNIVPAASAWRLDAEVTSDSALPSDLVAVFEANDPNLWIGTPDAVEQGAGLLFSAPMDWFGDGAFALARDHLRITLVQSGQSAVELTGC